MEARPPHRLAAVVRECTDRVIEDFLEQGVDHGDAETVALWRTAAAEALTCIAYHLEHGDAGDTEALAKAFAAVAHHGIEPIPIYRARAQMERSLVQQVVDRADPRGDEIVALLGALQAVAGLALLGYLASALEGVQREHRELLSTLGHMGVAVFRAGPDSRIETINDDGARILGAGTPGEIIGRRFAEFYADPADREEIRRRMLEQGKVVAYRFRAQRLDGRQVWLETNLLSRLDERGRLASIEGFGRDVSALAEAEEEVRTLNQFLQVVIDNANVWVNVHDLDGKVLIWNKAAEAISGYSRDEVIGRDDAWDLLYPDESYRDALRERSRRIIEGEEMRDFESVIRAKGGDLRTISWHSRRLLDESGEPFGTVGLGRDITREKALQGRLLEQERRHVEELRHQVRERTAELEHAYRDLKKLDRMKDRFLANISHELRTPLVSGLGYVELALDGDLGDLGDSLRGGLEVAHRNLRSLVKLIDDLLSFARLASSAKALDARPFDLVRAVADCVKDLRGRARKRSLDVAVELEEALPPVLGNEEQIRRVFTNLLSNAEKFTGDEARIEIVARAAPDGRIAVEVRDDGVGIPADERERVFDRFYRSAHAAARNAGTGIGLSLVREIIARHGGAVSAEGRDGRGTTIRFTLPTAGAGAAAEERPTAAQAPPETREATVLLVDDDPEIHELMAVAFQSSGDRLISAMSGEQGLQIAASDRPDLVLLDISMDGMDGVEVLRRLRAENGTQALPVFMLTARVDKGTQHAAREAGATGFITKPFAISELRAVIRAALVG